MRLLRQLGSLLYTMINSLTFKRVLAYIFLLFMYAVTSILAFKLVAHGIQYLFVLMCIISGGFLGWLLISLYQRKNLTFSHAIIAWNVVNANALLWGVMYLAATDHQQIAETMGRYIVTDLIGVSTVAMVKSIIENLSKNNTWPDKKTTSTKNPNQTWTRDL